jgi:hypothetical protein
LKVEVRRLAKAWARGRAGRRGTARMGNLMFAPVSCANHRYQ